MILDSKCSAHFYPSYYYLQRSSLGLMIGRVDLLHNLYILDKRPFSSSVASSSTHASFCGSLTTDGNLWHHRLGHPPLAKLQVLSGTLSLSKSSLFSSDHCSICHLAKQKCQSFPFNNNMSTNAFDLLHIDIWGPFSVESIEGYKYFLTIVDDCTRVTWIYMLKTKHDVVTIFPLFLKYVFIQFK